VLTASAGCSSAQQTTTTRTDRRLKRIRIRRRNATQNIDQRAGRKSERRPAGTERRYGLGDLAVCCRLERGRHRAVGLRLQAYVLPRARALPRALFELVSAHRCRKRLWGESRLIA